MNPMAPVKSLSFRPRLDRIVLAVGTDDGRLRTFEVATEKNLALLELQYASFLND
jgi:hypothetical protein